MFAQALADGGLHTAYAADIDLDPTSRAIAQANHRIDHTSLPQDLLDVTDDQIDRLCDTHGPFDLIIATTPCQGLSPANPSGLGLLDPRSALFLRAIEIILHVCARTPSTRYIAENVDFRKAHPRDYDTVTAALGEPEYIDAADTSAANRKRLFWHSLGPPDGLDTDGPVDANTLLDAGATLPRGATTAPCLMARWTCGHDNCKGRTPCTDPTGHAAWARMDTHNPVLIHQGGATRHLRPNEAERLMGLPEGYTAHTSDGSTVPDIDRLIRIGGGIDIRSVRTLVRRVKAHMDRRPTTRETTGKHIGDAQHDIACRVTPHTEWHTANIAAWITPGAIPGGADPQGWHASWLMHDAEDLIRCCTQGFPLRYEGDRERDVQQPNGQMCQSHPDVTAEELQKEVAAGRILGPYRTPPLPGFKVVPRGLKEEPTKFRPLSMGNMPFGDSVNDGIPKLQHIHLTRAGDIERKICAQRARTGQVWMAKRDIKMAYRTMPVRPEDWHLQGIKWDGEYYVDARMSFGCRSSVDQWLRFSDALAWTLLRWGVHALHYVDDFIFIAGSERECADQVAKFDHICSQWGVLLKDQADCGPATRLTALGVEYDLVGMRRRITPSRVLKLVDLLRTARTDRSRPHWEKLNGILWYVIKCVPLGAPHLQAIMETTLRARTTRRPVMPTPATLEAITWWTRFLQALADNDNASEWHGDSIIPASHASVTLSAMGDAGSEWGFGGHDDHAYFKAQWTPELWQEVQRDASSSSLHMEAIQLLVMARVMGHKWCGQRVAIELDSLGLVTTVRRGRHRHHGINAILRELTELQMAGGFTIDPRWVRRCHNEAADALSKNDMPRFWRNVHGDRTQLVIGKGHLRVPANAKTGGMRRTSAQAAEWDVRPTTRIAPLVRIPHGGGSDDLNSQLRGIVTAHTNRADPLLQARSGIKHYLRFCDRTGREADVAPEYRAMVSNVLLWMADAVQTYRVPGTRHIKKALSVTSVPTYLSHIDTWYATIKGTPKGMLTRHDEIKRHRRLITATYASARRQVHGITYERLDALVAAASALPPTPARMLRAAYTVAWFALLRPTELMLTPKHNRFDRTRHLRAGDIQYWKGETRVRLGAGITPDRITVNVKQSKTDASRLGANILVGATRTPTCPVAAMWAYTSAAQLDPEGPLFPGLTYATMLPTTRHLLGVDAELYGMHSFRVGGAQAMALAGRSVAYIMSRGRWKSLESVCRYVTTPDSTKAADSAAMAMTAEQRRLHANARHNGNNALPEGESLLPHAPN